MRAEDHRRAGACATALVLALASAASGVAGKAWARVEDENTARPAASTSHNPGYRLGAGDKLRVAVFGVDALGGEFTVPGSGRVSLPLIGDMQAAGLTAEQLQAKIAAALREGYVKDPRVNVEILNYRPFYILGEVNKPGEYPFTDGLTVMNAVARAEGFTYRAKTRVFKRRSVNERDEHQEPLTAGSPVEPGDTIRIEERSF